MLWQYICHVNKAIIELDRQTFFYYYNYYLLCFLNKYILFNVNFLMLWQYICNICHVELNLHTDRGVVDNWKVIVLDYLNLYTFSGTVKSQCLYRIYFSQFKVDQKLS